MKIVDEAAFPIDTADRQQMLNIVNSCIGTKFTQRFGSLIAVRAHPGGRRGRGCAACCLLPAVRRCAAALGSNAAHVLPEPCRAPCPPPAARRTWR